ncbi:MAG: hypothetical protein SA339_04980 [Methanomassiliicoccus sp.]|nr:hypothetical protein [Methanomassiliicoccus sp.]
MLSNVLITKTQRNLCQGNASLALKNIEEALTICDRMAQESTHGSMCFYRGLAYLALGRELDAHQDIDDYIKTAERADDCYGQALGHFYHAMVFERNREPCMALAELEMAKELVSDGDPALKGRLTAFIAHLWLRRGGLDEAMSLMAEATDLINNDVEPPEPINLGIAFLVYAELLAMKSSWDESGKAFQQSIQALRASRYGLYLEALASCWYAETNIDLGHKTEGYERLQRAKAIYNEMGNESQLAKIDGTITECECVSEEKKASSKMEY